MYTTNVIEAVNSGFRKVTKRGAFPNDKSVFKFLYIRVVELQKKWASRPIDNWSLGKQSAALERPPLCPLRQIRPLTFPTYTICLTLPLAEHGAVACIPDKANFKINHDFDCERYKQRNLVERFFQRIKNYRHISTRYDKLALCFENFVLVVDFLIATFKHGIVMADSAYDSDKLREQMPDFGLALGRVTTI